MKLQEEIEKLESAWDELFFSDDQSEVVKDRMESIQETINELYQQLEDGTIISNNSDNRIYNLNK